MVRATGLPRFTVPSLSLQDGADVARVLQERLNALNDLALTLKHIHWNVVGPHFIAVHQMLDPQVDAVRAMVDVIAERTWDDYSIGRAGAIEHLGALDEVYQGVIAAHRTAATDTEEPDPVTHDLLIGQLHELELFHWFVRAHLESSSGALSTEGATSEKGSARKASTQKRS